MPPKSTPEILAFRRRLLRWFRQHGRDLPWRRTRDPYHVVVSEFMLQQTQVSRVTEYYGRFLARYPTVQALARANPTRVREAWQGLGYYRRASNLHRLAQVVVSDHAGELPRRTDQLRALPGVGRYTAGAVATFAYELRTPAVDTNVGRVIRRVFLGARSPGRRVAASRKRPDGGTKPDVKSEKKVWELAERLVPRAGNAAWTFNQAIMELGALICTARVMKCGECPVRKGCKTGKR